MSLLGFRLEVCDARLNFSFASFCVCLFFVFANEQDIIEGRVKSEG